MIQMIKRIKNWFYNYREKRRREKTLEIIKQAKQAFLNGYSPFMCHCFYHVEHKFFIYRHIVDRIPEFKPENFDSTRKNPDGAWWNMSDRESRIKAFDKLIEIYSTL